MEVNWMPKIQENFLIEIVISPSEYHGDEISVEKKTFNWRCSLHKTTVRITIRMLILFDLFYFSFEVTKMWL